MRSRASDSRLWIGRRRRGETSRRQFESARGYLLFRQDRHRVRNDREAQRMAAHEFAIQVDHLLRPADPQFATSKVSRPPRILEERFARSTTAPPEPNSAMLTK